MDFFAKKKLMTDEPLRITHFLTSGIFKYRLTRSSFAAAFVLHIGIYFMEICILFKHPQYFIKYSPWIMARPLGLMAFLFMREVVEFMDNVWSRFEKWSLDSAGAEEERKIKAKIKNHHISLAITLAIGGTYGSLAMYPNPDDSNIFLNMLWFEKYYPDYSGIYNFTFKLTFAPMAFLTLAEILAASYASDHFIYQWHLLVKHLKNISVEWDGTREEMLLKDGCYQSVLKRRIKFCVERHVEFLMISRRMTVDLIQRWYVCGSMFGFLFLLGQLMMVYGMFVGNYESTFVNKGVVTSCTSLALIALVSLVHSGQDIESESENLLAELVKSSRWISYNKPNRASFLIMLTQSQRLITIHFSQKLAFNYSFGLNMIKSSYSAVSLFISIKK